MFDMSFFLDRDLHPVLVRLGKTRWTKYRPGRPDKHGRPTRMIGIDVEVLNALPREYAVAAARVVEYAQECEESRDSAKRIEFVVALSQVLADGPKLLIPDLATCRTLCEVDVPIKLDEFTMPHRAMLVQYPAEWVSEVEGKPGTSPRILLLAHDAEMGSVTAILRGVHEIVGNADFILTAWHRDADGVADDRTIEDILCKIERDEGPGFEQAVKYERVAFNMGLLAAYAGTRSAGWLYPKERARHERLAKKGPRGLALAAGDVERIEFAQDVRLLLGVTNFEERPEHQGGTHAAPGPHWRRQHWRMQPHGPANSLRKLTLVRRAFVRARALEEAGHSPDEVQVTYRAEMPGDAK